MSRNGKVSKTFIIMPFNPTAGAPFTQNTIVLHILPLSINRCFKAAVRNFFGLKIIQNIFLTST